ncbi:hypothetical protein [Polaromonas sp.]|uniref:hypothetical protein n=1 Tax=Polaromonas sp. TaxID=1869339 RepID=UPI0035677D58
MTAPSFGQGLEKVKYIGRIRIAYLPAQHVPLADAGIEFCRPVGRQAADVTSTRAESATRAMWVEDM